MSDQNKILTVSYGTFSCTLEGFDDPFGTMRGIAEYFRDLAAEDRYFGAEPPTPDVEALQAIAQKAIRNRVDARVGETGISLRATEPVEDAEIAEAQAPSPEPARTEAPRPAVDTEAPAPVTEPAPVRDTAPLAFDDDYLMADEPEDVLAVDIDAPRAPASGAPESIAEKLRRIRAVVSRNIEPSKAPVPGFDSDDEDVSALTAPRPRRDRALTETIASITADLADEAEETLSDEAGTPKAADPTVTEVQEAPALDEAVTATPAALSEDDPDEFEDDDFDEIETEDLPAEPVAVADEDEYADAVDTEDRAENDQPPVALTDSGDDPEDEDAARDEDAASISATLAALNASRDELASAFEDERENDEEIWDDLDEDEDEDAPRAVSSSAREDAEALAWVAPQDESAEDDDADHAEENVFSAPDTNLADSQGDDDSNDFHEDDQDGDRVADPAMDAEAEDRDAQKTVTAHDDAAEAAMSSAADTLEPLSDTNGNVGRLLKETDQKFAEDEGVRRRRVISQMRAAVAATKADRFFSKSVSPEEKTEAEQSPYRRDLNRVITSEVTPGPVTAPPKAGADAAHAAPAVRKPAPLVLVSSQRVDAEPTPVAPRPAKAIGAAGSFAEFASDMGAEELPDLLEAAAAYSAFVEGQPHFSRPEIMKRVARIDPALSLSREAGLRSFGMLLRQGKIRKLQRGQFTIAEDTRFNPAHRIAGE